MALSLGLLALLLSVAADPYGEELRHRLAEGGTITIVFHGDSVTEGMHLEDPAVDSFPAVFARMLRERYPSATVRTVNNGIAGSSTETGLMNFEAVVEEEHPDLVVLEFGGNDKGTGPGTENLPTYRANLAELIDRCHAIRAACIVIVPLMSEPVLDMPYPVAAREVAATMGVPYADVDTALKSRDHDYRGFFPYFIHPSQHDHGIIALELYRAFCELIRRPQALEATVAGFVLDPAPLGRIVEVPLKVRNGGPEPARVTITCEQAAAPLEDAAVPAGEELTWQIPIGLPHTLSGGRSGEWPLWLHVGAGEQHAFAIGRVVIVPRISLPAAGSPEAGIPVAVLGAPHLMIGRGRWDGENDLQAWIYLACDEETVSLRVDVRDDILNTKRGVPQSDGIELYFDLRDSARRGQPFHSRECASLFLTPAIDPADESTITTLSADQPPELLLALEPRWTALATGYRMELDLPRQVLDEIAGRRVTSFGFDLAVDDADATSRDTQMMWLGRNDNYVNPGRLGELCLDGRAEPGAVRLTIF